MYPNDHGPRHLIFAAFAFVVGYMNAKESGRQRLDFELHAGAAIAGSVSVKC